MKKRPSTSNLENISLIDILAAGLGIILLLLIVSIAQRTIIMNVVREAKAEEATDKLVKMVKNGVYPIHPDLGLHNYDSCYESALNRLLERNRSFPIFKLYDSYIELEETEQVVQPEELISQDSVQNTLNKYLKDVQKLGAHRIQIHIYSQELYYPFLYKLQKFGLKPNDYHFFPPAKMPQDHFSKNKAWVSINQPQDSISGLSQKESGPSQFEEAKGDSQQNTGSEQKSSFKKIKNHRSPTSSDSILGSIAVNPPANKKSNDSLTSRDTTPASNISKPVTGAPSKGTSAIKGGKNNNWGELHLPPDSIIILTFIPNDSFRFSEGGSRRRNRIVPPNYNINDVLDVNDMADDQEVTLQNLFDQTDKNGRYHKIDNTNKNASNSNPLNICNSENLEYFQELKASKTLIRRSNSRNTLGQNEALFNFFRASINSNSIPIFIDKIPLIDLGIKKSADGEITISIPMDTTITHADIKTSLNETYPDSVLCLFLKIRQTPFPKGGEPCFIFNGDRLALLNEDSVTYQNKHDWIPVIRIPGPLNPQKSLTIGYVFGQLKGKEINLNIKANNGEVILLDQPLIKKTEPSKRKYDEIILAFETLSIIIFIFFSTYKSVKHEK
jgi:hypothetical protein